MKAFIHGIPKAELHVHIARGIKFETVVQGIHRAMVDAGRQLGLSSKLIMCILRDLSVAEAMDTLEKARDCKDIIGAVRHRKLR